MRQEATAAIRAYLAAAPRTCAACGEPIVKPSGMEEGFRLVEGRTHMTARWLPAPEAADMKRTNK